MRSRPRSFTLVEVIVAVAILLIAIMGTIGAMAVASNLRLSTKQNEFATQALQQVIEEYRAMNKTNVVTTALADPDSLGAGVGRLVQTTDQSAQRTLGVGALKYVYILSERECRLLIPSDTNYDDVIDATDTYDLDGDGIFDENDADSDRTLYTANTSVIPVLIRIQWGRDRPVMGKSGNIVKNTLTSINDAIPTGAQVLGKQPISREFFIQTITFIYPTSTSN